MLKKQWAFLLLLIVILCFGQVSTYVLAESATVVKISGSKGNSVNVRKKPQGDIKFKVPFGENVEVLEEKENWAKIEYDGKTGWIKSEYLKVSADQSISADQEASVSHGVSVSPNVLTGSCFFTGTVCDDDWTYYIELPSPVSYQDPLDEKPITASRIYIYKDDASEIQRHIGAVVTLNGSLYNYRGGGELMFDGKPQMVKDSENSEYVSRTSQSEQASNGEKQFYQSMEKLMDLLNRNPFIASARYSVDQATIDDFNDTDNWYQYSVPIQLFVNDKDLNAYGINTRVRLYSSGDLAAYEFTNDAKVTSKWVYSIVGGSQAEGCTNNKIEVDQFCLDIVKENIDANLILNDYNSTLYSYANRQIQDDIIQLDGENNCGTLYLFPNETFIFRVNNYYTYSNVTGTYHITKDESRPTQLVCSVTTNELGEGSIGGTVTEFAFEFLSNSELVLTNDNANDPDNRTGLGSAWRGAKFTGNKLITHAKINLHDIRVPSEVNSKDSYYSSSTASNGPFVNVAYSGDNDVHLVSSVIGSNAASLIKDYRYSGMTVFHDISSSYLNEYGLSALLYEDSSFRCDKTAIHTYFPDLYMTITEQDGEIVAYSYSALQTTDVNTYGLIKQLFGNDYRYIVEKKPDIIPIDKRNDIVYMRWVLDNAVFVIKTSRPFGSQEWERHIPWKCYFYKR